MGALAELPDPPSDLLAGAALFLDFDGTLVELADTPDAIEVAEGLAPLLLRLRERLQGRLAIVSGRSIADLESHMRCSGIAISGSHGLELRLGDGSEIPLAAQRRLDTAVEDLMRFAETRPGVLLERKPFSVAVHYRQAPHEAVAVHEKLEEWARRRGLAVQHGKMVAELRPKGADKGDAIRALMKEPAFAGARPVVVGDDLTDEDGFVAAAEMGGAGIIVGPARASAARFQLKDVTAVSRWLEAAAG